MRLEIERERCGGYGQCNLVDETLFPLDDDGFSLVRSGDEVPAGREDAAAAGVSACPLQVLSLS